MGGAELALSAGGETRRAREGDGRGGGAESGEEEEGELFHSKFVLALMRFPLNELCSQTSVEVNEKESAPLSPSGSVEEWVDRVEEDILLCPLEVRPLSRFGRDDFALSD